MSDATTIEDVQEDETEENDEDMEDMSDHIDLTKTKDILEKDLTKCKFCPFTVKSEDEIALKNLRKHEEFHFRKCRYSCKHCSYSSGRLLLIKKHQELLHGDAAGVVIQSPKSSVQFSGKKIKMSFSFVKKNAFFKSVGLANKRVLEKEKEGKVHNHHTRAGGKRGNLAIRDSSPASKRRKLSKTDPLLEFNEAGEKTFIKCHHCPFKLPWNHGVTSRLIVHENCHFRKAGYECNICHFSSNNIMSLKSHVKVHVEITVANSIIKRNKQVPLRRKIAEKLKAKALGTPKGERSTYDFVGSESEDSNQGSQLKPLSLDTDIMKDLTHKARVIKANISPSSGGGGDGIQASTNVKASSKTVRELLQANLAGN